MVRGKKKKKNAKRLQQCFDFSASKPVTLSPSRPKTGTSSVTAALVCKSSLSPVHFKLSPTLDSATSLVCGGAPLCQIAPSDIKAQSPKLLFGDLSCCQQSFDIWLG